MYELTYVTFPSSITMYVQSFIYARLMNDLGYGQLSNPNGSLKLVLMHVRSHRELFRYFHYLGQGFHGFSFLESIFSNTEGE